MTASGIVAGSNLNIGRRVAAGAAWMVLMRASVRSIGFVSMIVLARLLTPQDFGLVSLARAIAEMIELLSEFNFDLALIRNQRAGRKQYDTAWTLSVCRGLLIAAMLTAAAPFVGGIFEDSRLEPIFYCFAFWNVLHGIQNIGVVNFRKDLHLDKEFRFLVLPRIAGVVVAIPLAFLWQNHWALIVGILGAKTVSLAASYWMAPYRPRFSFAATRELLSFSKWTMLFGILQFATFRIDTFFIGKFAGVRSVGIYNIAFEIANLPTSELAAPIGRALYPGLSTFGDELGRLKNAFLRVIGITALFAIPLGVGIGLTADLLVKVLLGQKWLDAIPLIQILLVFAVCRIFFSNVYAVILAAGKPNLMLWGMLPTICVQIPLLLWATPRYGPAGAACSVAAGSVMIFIVNLFVVRRLLTIPLRDQLRVLWRCLVSAALMAVAVHWIRPLFAEMIPIAELTAVAATGAVTYVLAVLALWYLAQRPDGAESDLLSALPSSVRRRFLFLSTRT